MSLIQIDLVGWLPDSLKQQVIDSVVTFVAEQAEKAGHDDVSQALKRLRSDAAFQDVVDRGLKEATDRFVREYTVEDEDLVAAIARDPDFWKAESVREALLEIVRHPGVYLAEERMTLAQSFADVLSQRINRQRVDRAVTFYLRFVAESLWHLEPLRPMYELQMQRLSIERATEMVQELRGMRADVQGAMMALVQAIGEQQKRLPAPDRSALPEPKKVYHNLPQPDYGTFVGRENELAQVHRILRPYPHSREHLITIDGIGGIGKSALALEVAHRYLRDYDRLPPEERFEAIIWTSAKASVLTADGIAPRQQITRTLDDIYTTISVTLEREDITRAQPEEQDELVTKALAQQRTLLIIDNLETVDDERVNAFLRELPAPTKAIVTTRHRIDVAYPVRLTGMPREDGLALIAQECEKKEVTLTETEAEKLYDRTGGVPLAIVWSVAQMGYGYSVEAVLRRLGQPSEDISRFCFEWVIEHIRGTDAHKLLVALSLFATDASRGALGYVAELGEDVLSRDEGLVTLERLSLVNKRGDRFWMLPLIKAFVSAEGNDEARSRYIEFFAEFCRQQIGTKYWDGLSYDARQMVPELENLIFALDWAFESENWKAVPSIFVGVVHPLVFSSTTLSKRIESAEKALVAVEKLDDTEMLAWIHIDALGVALRAIGKLDEALNHIKTGQLIARKASLVDCLAIADTHLADWAIYRGDYATAFQHIESALSNAEGPIAKVRAHYTRSRFYRRRAEWEEVRKSSLFAAEVASEVGDSLDELRARLYLGESYLRMSQLDSAEKTYLRAQELANKYGWLGYLAHAMMGLAEFCYIRGAMQPARDYAEQAGAIYKRTGRTNKAEEANGFLRDLEL